MVRRNNLRYIRKLLTEKFSTEELRQLCFDYHEFREVYYQLAPNSGRNEIVQKIIEFAEQRNLFEYLLELIQEENPTIHISSKTIPEEKINLPNEEYHQKLLKIVAHLSEKLEELQELKEIPSDIEFSRQIASQERKFKHLQEKLQKELTTTITYSSAEDTAYSANRLVQIKSLEEKISQLYDEQEVLRKAFQAKSGRFSPVSRRTSLFFIAIFLVVIVSLGVATSFVLYPKISTNKSTPEANARSTSVDPTLTIEVSSTPIEVSISTPNFISQFTPTKDVLPTATTEPTILFPTEELSPTPEPFTPTPKAAPTLTRSPTFSPTPVATATPIPEPTTKLVGVQPGVFENFESTDSCMWTRGDQAYGNLTCSNFEGQSVGKLTYDFSKASESDSFVVFKKNYPLADNILSVKIYGDNSGHYLNVWVEDDDGEVWQVPFGKINYSKWYTMTTDLRAISEWPYSLISGSTNKKLDHPIRFNALVLDYIPNTSSLSDKGEIYIDNLTNSEEQILPPSPAPVPQPLPAPSKPTIFTGRIAFPMDDGSGNYDVWVRSLATGENILAVSRARQPNFYKKDGRLLVNGENNEKGNNIILTDSAFNIVDMISEFPEDEHPFWDTGGSRLIHGNPVAIGGLSHLFVHCSLKRPQFEDDPQCQDLITYGVLGVSNPGDMPGRYPVWLPDNRIAFQGLGDTAPLGINLIDSSAALKYVGQKYNLPERPIHIPQTTSNSRPTDAWNDRLFFFADDIDGNWEVYSIKLDGSDRINLSNSPNSSDGLPTISPDGQWVAFVSDRSGTWGIWAVPIAGGIHEKLFDYPKANPWGIGPHDWTTERISWGP